MAEENASLRWAARIGRNRPASRPLGRFPLGYRVVGAVGVLLALVAASIATAVLLVVGLRHHQAQLNGRAVPYATAIAAAALEAKGIANDERGFLLTGDPRFRAQMEARIVDARAAFATAVRASDGPRQHRAATDARAGFERWIEAVERQFGAYEEGAREASIAAALGPGRALRKDYEQSLARAEALGESALASRGSSVAAASTRSVAILLGCLAGALALGIAVGVWLVRTVARPVDSLVHLFADAAGVARTAR